MGGARGEKFRPNRGDTSEASSPHPRGEGCGQWGSLRSFFRVSAVSCLRGGWDRGLWAQTCVHRPPPLPTSCASLGELLTLFSASIFSSLKCE